MTPSWHNLHSQYSYREWSSCARTGVWTPLYHTFTTPYQHTLWATVLCVILVQGVILSRANCCCDTLYHTFTTPYQHTLTTTVFLCHIGTGRDPLAHELVLWHLISHLHDAVSAHPNNNCIVCPICTKCDPLAHELVFWHLISHLHDALSAHLNNTCIVYNIRTGRDPLAHQPVTSRLCLRLCRLYVRLQTMGWLQLVGSLKL